MCIIIYRPANAKLQLTHDMLQAACNSNPHGFGLMWPMRGRLIVAKYLPEEQQTFIRRALALQRVGTTFAAHCRYATHGAITRDNVHPFWITKHKQAVMHNGIISIDCTPGMSDTRTFVNTVLRRLPHGWHRDPALHWLVSQAVQYSKLLLLDGRGEAVIINEKLGSWLDGAWMSNTSFLAPTPSPMVRYVARAAHWTQRWPTHWRREQTRAAPIQRILPAAPVRKLYMYEQLMLCETCLRRETNIKDAIPIEPSPGDKCELCGSSGPDLEGRREDVGL